MIQLHDYNIQFQDKSFKELQAFLVAANYSKVFVLVDENTATHCLPILKQHLDTFHLNIITIKAGEAHKNISTCQVIWEALMQQQADRKSVLVNLGGGVIGDMGGFCASTFKRGIDFIQMPTTLLAQVDASIGGKLGVDFALVKNSIGLFNNPKAVFLHSDFFETLPFEELRSGFAEVIKHALIQNANDWEAILAIKNLRTMEWEAIIEHSLNVKKNIVEQDPFEQNIRKSLNFGHTIGHAVESLSWETDQPLLHGEAVAIGMICESFLSHRICGLALTDLEQISRYIIALYSSYNLETLSTSEILRLIQQDKKNAHNQICFSLLEQVGQCKINVHAKDDLILDALDYYTNLSIE